MDKLETDEYIERLYDEFTSARAALSLTLRNDKELTKERIVSQKLNHIDSIIKHLLKYRSLVIKERLT